MTKSPARLEQVRAARVAEEDARRALSAARFDFQQAVLQAVHDGFSENELARVLGIAGPSVHKIIVKAREDRKGGKK